MNDLTTPKLTPAGSGTHAPPVAIRALGRFAVTVEGAPLPFSRKAPKKPLAVLTAIIALGGPCVCTYRLTDALWPDLEADAAHQAFNMALHRLRRLLRRHDAVGLRNGRVGLDPGLCEVDVWAFERLMAAAQSADAQSRDPADILISALTLYRGAFLGDEEIEPWAIPVRERLRDKFVALIESQARRLEALDRWDESLRFYRQALGVDPHGEAFCQGVMRAALHLGRNAEGITVFRWYEGLRPALAGAAPSADTKRLLRSLLG
jgi:DNA-binding SARP family transcriptional activator